MGLTMTTAKQAIPRALPPPKRSLDQVNHGCGAAHWLWHSFALSRTAVVAALPADLVEALHVRLVAATATATTPTTSPLSDGVLTTAGRSCTDCGAYERVHVVGGNDVGLLLAHYGFMAPTRFCAML